MVPNNGTAGAVDETATHTLSQQTPFRRFYHRPVRYELHPLGVCLIILGVCAIILGLIFLLAIIATANDGEFHAREKREALLQQRRKRSDEDIAADIKGMLPLKDDCMQCSIHRKNPRKSCSRKEKKQ